MSRARTPAGRFLAPNGRTTSKPLRQVPSLAINEDDRLREVEEVRAAASFRDEPEGIGPAILGDWADVNRRILTQHVIHEIAQAQQHRNELTPQNRLDTIHARAKHAHVDLSHPIHLVQKAIDKARLRDQPIAPAALDRLAGLEELLDGVSIRRLAA